MLVSVNLSLLAPTAILALLDFSCSPTATPARATLRVSTTRLESATQHQDDVFVKKVMVDQPVTSVLQDISVTQTANPVGVK